MCHLILLMPIITLPVFWIMPLNLALPLYLVIAVVSGLFYWVIIRAMTKKVDVGIEGLMGAEAEVLCQANAGPSCRYLVRSKGELWTARSTDKLEPGERVRVSRLSGVGLLVERPVRDKVLSKNKKGTRENGWNCH